MTLIATLQVHFEGTKETILIVSYLFKSYELFIVHILRHITYHIMEHTKERNQIVNLILY